MTRRPMAHKPLVVLPNGLPVWEEDVRRLSRHAAEFVVFALILVVLLVSVLLLGPA